MAVLETPCLSLRPFREEDVDLLAELMANLDFMRFSRGVYNREQTGAFLEKILSWYRADRPSQFAIIIRDLKLDRVVSLIHPENVASRRVAEKIGMTPDRETIFRGFPTIVFAISREIWWAKSGV